MALSAAERQKRRRDKIKSEGKMSVRLYLKRTEYRRLQRNAKGINLSVPNYILHLVSIYGS